MVRIVFDGVLKSKGHPPSKWNLPKWLHRAFTWESTKPILYGGDFDEGDVRLAKAFGPFEITADEFDGTLYVALWAHGIEVREWKIQLGDFEESIRIKWSAAGQKLDGVFTATMV